MPAPSIQFASMTTPARGEIDLVNDTARAWLHSFGIGGEPGAERRLSARLGQRFADLLRDGPVADLQAALDTAAEGAIADWFCYMRGDDLARSRKGFDRLRLAFLSANRDAVWSKSFLDFGGIAPALREAIEAASLMPTPMPRQRVMPRQSLVQPV